MLLYDTLCIKMANWLAISISKSVLSLIFSIPTCFIKHNLALLFGFAICMFVLHVFSLVLGALSVYLCSNTGHQLFGHLAFMIDFYLITFWTHMDIFLGFLSSTLTRSWYSFNIYSHFSFDILLKVVLTIKTYTQLWNKAAFTFHSSEHIYTHLSHQHHPL